AASAGYVARRYLGGADISTLLFDGFLRGSCLYSRPRNGEDFFLAGGGYEYSFSGGLTVIAEYFYNSASVNASEDVMTALIQKAVSGMTEKEYLILSHRPITANRHYTGLYLSFPLTPLLQSALFIIGDIEGRGICAMPSLSWNFRQNCDMFISAASAYQKKGEKESEFTPYNKKAMVSAGMMMHF
ncbi:MAG: hypothetical protein ACRCUT_09290, partial [Spirochaetota bacterium]